MVKIHADGAQKPTVWVPTQKRLHGAVWFEISKWDRGLIKFVHSRALNLKKEKKGSSADCNSKFFEDLKKLRQDKCNELMADAMRPPDDDGAEQPPRRKKAKLAQPRRYANLLPEVIELAVPEVNSDTPGRVMRLLTENIGEQKFWIELTGPNLEYVKSAVLAATPGKKKSSTQNDPAEHQPLQMPSPEVLDSIS